MSIVFATPDKAGITGAGSTYTGSAKARDGALNASELTCRLVRNGPGEQCQIDLDTAPGGYAVAPLPRPLSDLGTDESTADGTWLSVRTAGGSSYFDLDHSDGNVIARAGTTSGSTWSPSVNTTYTIDLLCETDGTDHTISLYVDGLLVSTATRTNANQDVMQQVFFNHSDIMGNTANSGDIYYSEIFIDDSDSTIGCHLATMAPASDGSDTDWTGDYTDLADTSDENYLTVGSTGQLQSWDPASYPPARTLGRPSRAVVAVADVLPGGSVGGFTQYVDISSTHYFADSITFAGSRIANQSYIWGTNPATAGAWAISDFTGIEVGIRSDA